MGRKGRENRVVEKSEGVKVEKRKRKRKKHGFPNGKWFGNVNKFGL